MALDPSLLAAAWALPWAAAALVLVLRRGRIGRLRAASWLVAIGAVLLATEDGLLSLWLPLAERSVDPDGLADVAGPHARAHMLGAGAWTLVAAGLAVSVARGPFARGERWAWRALLAAFVVGGAADLVAYGALYTHGLALPLPGSRGGFGWPPVAVAFLSWGAGLAIGRPRRAA